MSSLGKPVYDPILGAMRSGLKPGAGIDMSGGTVSVITPPEGVPYVAGEGVAINGATIGADLDAGYRMEIVSGSTIGQQRYFPIETVTGSSVTLQAGHAYKMYATSTAITLNSETVPEGKFGLEGHLEIYVAGTGYVVTGSNVVLANALEPDSVNNCTVRFHDGLAIISVEDHVAGYIVVNGSTSGEGSLAYGIATSTNDYVAFDASLNGTVIPLAGAVAEGEKHIVGNGYNETTLTGAIDCSTNKVTVANLSLQDVGITGGTLTIGDAKIPSGSTVAVSGGGLAVKKVTGAGSESVINLNNGRVALTSNSDVFASNVTFASGGLPVIGNGGCVTGVGVSGTFVSCTISGARPVSGVEETRGGGVYLRLSDVTFSGCTITDNWAQSGGGCFFSSGCDIHLIECVVSGNTQGYFGDVGIASGAIVTMQDSIIDRSRTDGTATFVGSNTITILGGNGSAIISSGAVLDLTGNTNPTPIAPGGGITFEQGGATVLTGGTAGVVDAQYMLGGMTVPQIGNTNVMNLNNGRAVLTSNSEVFASNVTFASGGLPELRNGGCVTGVGVSGTFVSCMITSARPVSAVYDTHGGGVYLRFSDVTFSGCTITDNWGQSGGGCFFANGCDIRLIECVVSGNTQGYYGDVGIASGAIVTMQDSIIDRSRTDGTATFVSSNTITILGGDGSAIISSGASINLTSSIAPGGGIVVDGGTCTINGVTVEPTAEGSAYTSIINSGGTLYIDGNPVE